MSVSDGGITKAEDDSADVDASRVVLQEGIEGCKENRGGWAWCWKGVGIGNLGVGRWEAA